MNKRILTLVISLVVLLSFAACGTTAPPPPPVDTTPADTTPAPTGPALVEAIEDPTRNIHFAVLFGVGGRGDNAFNDEVYEGVTMAVEMFGATYNYAEPSDIGEFEIQLRAFAESGEYDVIIAVSNQMVDALLMVAEDFPEQRFSMIDVAVYDVPNIWSLTASHPEQHFLSGILAGLAVQDERFPLVNPENNILGFCVSVDTPVARAQASGFFAGARLVNPEVEILQNFIGGFNDPATAKELATVMYERGANIISTNSGQSANGVFAAAVEQNRYVIGTALAMVNADHSLSTSMKFVQQYIVVLIDALYHDRFEGGEVTVFGIADDVCGISFHGVNTEIPQDILDIIERARLMVADGTFVLPTDFDQIDEWLENNSFDI